MSADVWYLQSKNDDTKPPPPPPGGIMSAYDVRAMFGVAAHPNRADLVYGKNVSNIAAWAPFIDDMGMGYFRGLISLTSGGAATARTQAALDACRALGLKWLMIVTHEAGCFPTDTSIAQVKATVDWVARYASDVCAGIEGLNEPNSNRGNACHADVPADWAATTVSYQKAIYQRARDTTTRTQGGQTFSNFDRIGTVPLVASSLQDVNADRSYTQSSPIGGKKHWHQLASGGIGQWVTHYGSHTYSGGGTPLNNFGPRRQHMIDAFGPDIKIWATEAGDQTAIATTAGHHPVSEAAQGTYGPRAILEFIVKFGYPMANYELLDDPDPGAKDQVECNFGKYRVPSNEATAYDPDNWTAKPVVATVTAFMASMQDPPGTGPYVTVEAPYAVDKQGHAEVQHYPVQRADGTTKVYFYRDLKVWNEIARTAISVGSVNVTLTDSVGARTVAVNAEVSWVTLR